MSRRSKTVFLLVLIVLGAAMLAIAQTANCIQSKTFKLCGTERRITTNLADQFDPAISGNIIVYTDNRNGNLDLYYTHLTTGSELAVVNAPGDQELSDVSNGLIVYSDLRPYAVVTFDINTGSSTNVSGDKLGVDPAISANLVVWAGVKNQFGNLDIYAKCREGDEVRLITDFPIEDSRPVVSDKTIVWQRCEATCDIYAYDWDTQLTRRLTDIVAADNRLPSVSNPRVSYESLRSNERDIYVYDLATGKETRLALPGEQISPKIFGDWISLEDLGTGISHLKLWHVPSGEVFDLNQVPGGPPATASQFFSDIDGNRVVYTDDRNGQLDIYMFEFHLESADSTPPELHGIADMAVDATAPQGALVPLNVYATDEDPTNPVVTCLGVQVTAPSIPIPPTGTTLFPFGTTTVSCSATDAAANTATANFAVLVKAAPEQVLELIDLVNDLNIKQGIVNSLDTKLQNAQAALTAANAGNRSNVCGLMSSFINETTAQSGKAISATDAQTLINKAVQIKAVLGCS